MKTLTLILLLFTLSLNAQQSCIDLVTDSITSITRTVAQGKVLLKITAELPGVRDTVWTDTTFTVIDTIHVSPVTVQFIYAVDTPYAMQKYLNAQKDGFAQQITAYEVQMQRALDRKERFDSELARITTQRDSLIAKRQQLINLLQ